MFQRLLAASGTAIIVALSGCGGGGGATPEAAVRNFFEATKKGEAGKQEWMACFTQKVRGLFERMEEMQKKSGMPKQQDMIPTFTRFEIKGTTMDGETARVAVSTTEVRDGKEVTEEGVVGLKREGGAWKVYGFGKAGEQFVNMEEQAEKSEAMFKAMEKSMGGMKGLAPEGAEGTEGTEEEEKAPLPPAMTPAMQEEMKKSMEKMKAEMEKAKIEMEKANAKGAVPKEAQDAFKKAFEGFGK